MEFTSAKSQLGQVFDRPTQRLGFTDHRPGHTQGLPHIHLGGRFGFELIHGQSAGHQLPLAQVNQRIQHVLMGVELKRRKGGLSLNGEANHQFGFDAKCTAVTQKKAGQVRPCIAGERIGPAFGRRPRGHHRAVCQHHRQPDEVLQATRQVLGCGAPNGAVAARDGADLCSTQAKGFEGLVKLQPSGARTDDGVHVLRKHLYLFKAQTIHHHGRRRRHHARGV